MATVNGDAVAMFVLHLSIQLLRMGMDAEEAAKAEASLLKNSGLFDGPQGEANRKAVHACIGRLIEGLSRKEAPKDV